MSYYKVHPKRVNIFLEYQKTRKFVGTLSQENGKYIFRYDETYRLEDNCMPFGPHFPVSEREHVSKEMFSEFQDRIPSRRNPAFVEYCEIVGISSTETDYFILLPTLGKRGPSSFIIERAYLEEASDTIEKIKLFLKNTQLSHTDFSHLLDIPRTSLMRLLNGKSTDKTLLRLTELYLTKPELLRELFAITSGRITPQKLKNVKKYLLEHDTQRDGEAKPTGS